MRARDVMTSAVISVTPSTPVERLIETLLEHGISGVPVLEDGLLVGIVTEGDLILRERAQRKRSGMAYLFQQLFEDHAKLAQEYRKAHGLTAEDVMTRGVVTCNPGTPVAEVAHLMAEKHIKRIPVIQDDRLVGIVTRSDIMKALFRRMTDDPSPSINPLDDRAIGQTLLDHLRGEPWAEVDRLQVETEHGVVLLRGVVENEQERAAIELAAQRIAGVVEVRNELQISAGYAADEEP